MRRVHVPILLDQGERLVLEPSASHHLLRVLRLPRGEQVLLFDGAGQEAVARLVEVQGEAAVLEIETPVRSARPPFALHLLLGLPKGPAMDRALRMATEAGATHIHPLLTRRSVPRGERAERWVRLTEAAAAQCGRADLPQVLPLTPLEQALGALPPSLDRRVAVPGAARLAPATADAAVLVGPEGGLDPAEVDLALQAGFAAMGLGRWVLRADTAAAVALALTAPVDP